LNTPEENNNVKEESETGTQEDEQRVGAYTLPERESKILKFIMKKRLRIAKKFTYMCRK